MFICRRRVSATLSAAPSSVIGWRRAGASSGSQSHSSPDAVVAVAAAAALTVSDAETDMNID